MIAAKELASVVTGVIAGTLLTGGAAHVSGIDFEKADPVFYIFGIGFIAGCLAACLFLMVFFMGVNKSLTIQEVNHGKL